MKKVAKNDAVVSTLLTLAEGGLLRDQYQLLGAIFDNKALPSKEEAGVIEMRKADFVEMLKEADLLIVAKAKEEEKKDSKAPAQQEGEQKAVVVQFEESDVMEVIMPSQSFDEDQLTYPDFLDALIRVALAYPFSEE